MRRALTVALLIVSACRVSFPDGKYACKTDADCAGGGYVCVGTPLYCCLPDGDEVCGDGVDNDCNGIIDVESTTELCNGRDDNCDGRIDEGFILVNNPMNCGRCGNVCASNEACMGTQCIVRRELSCSDGADDDGNGKIDCLDPQCEGKFCGNGCACKALAKSEVACADGMDNDGDAQIDCFDTDCENASCGSGCACRLAGIKRESNCNDQLDNDGDMMADCADSDCLNEVCTPLPLFYTCTAGGQCRCNGGQQVAETGSFCRDGLDNDCNGKRDCAEMSCNGQMCATDAGTGMCSSMACMP